MIRQRGFALLAVLWAMALLSLLVSQLALSGRDETKLAANLRASAQLEAIADGAIHEAIFRLYQGTWIPDRRYQVTFGQTVTDIRIESQMAKINPNLVSERTLQALLLKVGTEPARAKQLSRSIVEWRTNGRTRRSPSNSYAAYQAAQLPYGPPGRLFNSVDELGLVLGMTPDVLQRIRQLLSVYQKADAADLEDGTTASTQSTTSSPDPWVLGSTGRIMVVLIDATAVGADGAQFRRDATVKLRAEPSLDQDLFEVLTWDTGSE